MGDEEKLFSLKKYVDKKDIDEKKLSKVLDRLEKVTMTVELLQSTGIGKSVNHIRKRKDVGDRARDLIQKWKNIATPSPTKNGNLHPASSSKSFCHGNNEKNNTSESRKHKRTSEPYTNNASPDKKKHKMDESNKNNSSSSPSPSPSKTDKVKTGTSTEGVAVSSTDNDDHNGMSFEDFMGYDMVKVRKKDKGHQVKTPVKTSSRPSEKTKNKSTESHSTHKKHKSKDKDRDKKHKHNVKETKEDKTDAPLDVPVPVKQVKLSETDIMSSLPDITPNYKPMRFPELDSPKKHKALENFNTDIIGAKSHTRTAVYAGKKNSGYSTVPTLLQVCLTVLKDNIDAIEGVGDIPYYLMKSVLERCTPTQLYTLEDFNPQFIGETEEIWMIHVKRDFKGVVPNTAHMETWRELYIRKHEEREHRLKKITANITMSMAKQLPVRVAKLAYVDSAVKPPRDVRRRQIKHGTAGPVAAAEPLKKLTSHGGSGVFKNPVPAAREPLHPSKPKAVKIAPMMKKTLKFLKGMRR